MNLSKTQLLNHLEQFYGTQYYYPLWPKVFLTDGAQFLAQEAACYWIMDAIASHIVHLPKTEVFVSCKLKVENGTAELLLDDGNGNVLATQKIAYTAFPLDSIALYAYWDSERWILMLPTEY
jgi:hypothetical protein